ncbi:MAG: hypothetical protein R3A13_08950 [Bdellovibrionota bacterium]
MEVQHQNRRSLADRVKQLDDIFVRILFENRELSPETEQRLLRILAKFLPATPEIEKGRTMPAPSQIQNFSGTQDDAAAIEHMLGRIRSVLVVYFFKQRPIPREVLQVAGQLWGAAHGFNLLKNPSRTVLKDI